MGLPLSGKQSSHHTQRNNHKLTSSGFKQQPICTPLAPTMNKIIYKTACSNGPKRLRSKTASLVAVRDCHRATCFFLTGALCLSAGRGVLRLTRLPRHDRGPVPGGNRSAASCLCTVLRRALYHYSTRSPHVTEQQVPKNRIFELNRHTRSKKQVTTPSHDFDGRTFPVLGRLARGRLVQRTVKDFYKPEGKKNCGHAQCLRTRRLSWVDTNLDRSVKYFRYRIACRNWQKSKALVYWIRPARPISDDQSTKHGVVAMHCLYTRSFTSFSICSSLTLTL